MNTVKHGHLLLEIGVEEIPAAYMPDILEELRTRAAARLAEARLAYERLEVLGTPRRIALTVEAMIMNQPEGSLESRGPKKSAAFDGEGKPTRAASGFARSQGLEVEQLEIRSSDGVEYLYAVKKLPGQPAQEVLKDLLPELILSLPFPKSMRWGYHQVRFARPIRWLVALLDDQVIDFGIAGVRSGQISESHRFLGSGAVKIREPQVYRDLLRENFVIVDPDERRKMIWSQVQEQAAKLGGRVAENPELLEEVNYLLEYPTAFTGSFSPSYLDVPVEVLTTSMIANQRYFPVFGDDGQLLPNFISVRNGLADYMENVIAGNEKVLRARLEDALFFWKEDTRNPLEAMNDGLEKVMFHARLGSLLDKVQRMRSLALQLGEMTGLGQPELLERAALLCKADLRSSMVYEFPELQGIMGRYYALKSGEHPEVAEAVMEHYLPRSTGAGIPATTTGQLLALAEKFDNMVGFFAVGMRPSGAQDPYALRRNAFGIIAIARELAAPLNLGRVIEAAYEQFGSNPHLAPLEETREAIIDFVMQRLRGQIIEQGYDYDAVDSVLSVARMDIKDIMARVAAVQEFKGTVLMEDLLVAYSRANNLSKKWDKTDIDPGLFSDESEGALYERLKLIEQQCAVFLEDRDYAAALRSLASLRPEADRFFEGVMVMVEDERVRANRLGILKQMALLFRKVAEFGQLVTA